MDAINEGISYSIDPNLCIECGTCPDACPVGAIHKGALQSSINTNAFTTSNYEIISNEDARESMRNIAQQMRGKKL